MESDAIFLSRCPAHTPPADRGRPERLSSACRPKIDRQGHGTGPYHTRGELLFHASWSTVRRFFHDAAGSLYHILVVALSAGIALLLPTVAAQFLSLWSRVEHQKLSLLAVEVAAAVVLMLCFNFIHRSIQDRTLATVATGAGLVSFFPRRARDAHGRIKILKEEQGTGRTIMVIGSSGYNTFVDRVGDLSSVLEQALGARILLVNPYSRDASARIRAIAHPDYTLTTFRDEVRQSIALLKRLKAVGKDVKLKLYSDPPLVKMVILGDYLWLQHYHADLDVQTMPEYVLRRNRKDHGLYSLYAHYFIQRWDCDAIPEYDLETDELVYRARNGNEIRREPFGIESTEEERPLVDALDLAPQPARLD